MGRAYLTWGRSGNRAAAALCLLAAAPGQYDDGGQHHAATSDTASERDFGDPRAGLDRLMRAHRTHRAGPQHFCVVGWRYADGDRDAQIYWREGRRLVLWEGAVDPRYTADAIAGSRRDLDLDTDVVPDGRVNTSTYMLFASEVRDMLADCAAHGRRYVLPYPVATKPHRQSWR